MSSIENYVQKYKKNMQAIILTLCFIVFLFLMPTLIDIVLAYGNYVGTIARKIIENICIV